METSRTAQRVNEIIEAFDSPDVSAPDQFCDAHDPQAVAFSLVDGSLVATPVTFGELADRSRRAAAVLHSLGVRKNDRVASLMGKGVDLPSLILGAWRLGAVYVPLFTAFGADAVGDRLARAEVKVVVTDERQRSKILDGPWQVLVTGTRDGQDSFDRLLGEIDPWVGQAPMGQDVPLVHMFTSGTTGKPKSVVHPKMYVAGWVSYLEAGLGVSSSGTFWSAADPGWAYGLYTAIIAPLAAGITSMMTTETFQPAMAWQVLDRLEVTDFAAAPTALRAMKAVAPVAVPAHLARVSSAGEPLTPDVLEWTKSLGVPVHDHFGQTEIGMPAGFPHQPSIEVPVQPQAMGVSLPGWTVVVLDVERDERAPDGVTGRLAIDVARSPFFTFTGYGVDRDQRGDRFVGNGAYYVTGDLATNDDGVLRFSSRDDDVILMAGYRIGPFEIESVLLAHDAVREAAVVATPDEVRGEVLCAFIVAAQDAEVGDELVTEIQQWVKTSYGAHAYPRRIEFVDTLPKTESGKIQRAVLRRHLADGYA